MRCRFTFLALALFIGTVNCAYAQTAFTSVSRNTEMLSSAVAELQRSASPPASQRDTDSEPYTNRTFSLVDDDTTAGAVVTNGPSGGTDFAQATASTGQFSAIRNAGVVLCAESRVFATLESPGPGVPELLFATGEADNLFEYTFQINANTPFQLSGEMSSFPNLDVNDAEFELRGPITAGNSPRLIFGLSVSGQASRGFAFNGSLRPGRYTLKAAAFSNLSGRGGNQPDTAGAEIELFLQLGNTTLLKKCEPPPLGGVLYMLLGD